jgi:hypothetical protein
MNYKVLDLIKIYNVDFGRFSIRVCLDISKILNFKI